MHLDCLALRWLLEGHRWASCPCHQLCPDGLPTGLGAESHPPGCSSHGLFWLVSSESLWGACVNSLPEARFTLSRVMLRPPPPTSGDTGLCLGTSVIHTTGGILLASDTWGPGGLLYTHSALDGWDVSSALGMGEASSCLES